VNRSGYIEKNMFEKWDFLTKKLVGQGTILLTLSVATNYVTPISQKGKQRFEFFDILVVKYIVFF
jgi:hypothetical protein